MSKVKLVIISVAPGFHTGEDLKEILINQGFEVPEVQPYVAIPLPAQPTTPKPDAVTQTEAFLAWQEEWRWYNIERRPIVLANQINKLLYFKQFADFAVTLQNTFVLASYVNGQWVLGGTYNFELIAKRLMGGFGSRPADPIQLICFGTFGS